MHPDNPHTALTAKDRKGPGWPVRFLHEQGLLRGHILDFGSGKGADVRWLRKMGYIAVGYDPHYDPGIPPGIFDTVLCLYVLNVLLPEERPEVMRQIQNALHPNGTAWIAVRRDVHNPGYRNHPQRPEMTWQDQVVLPYPSRVCNSFCEIYEVSY